MTTGKARREKQKQVHQDFADNWSVIGYRYTFYDKGIRKLIWILLLLASTGFAAYLFYGTVEDFFDYSTYIVTDVDYDIDSATFPTVTFCNMNPQNVATARSTGLVKDLAEFRSLYKYLAEGNLQSMIGVTPYDNVTVLAWMKRNNLTTHQEAITALEVSFKDMAEGSLLTNLLPTICSFENSKCTKDDMTDTMSWDHSMCQQFNPFNPLAISKNSTTVGINGGITLYLDLGTSTNEMSSYPYKGMDIIVNPFGIPHVMDKYNEQVFVSPGSMNVISIDMRKLTLLESPYATNCTYNQPLAVMQSFPYSKPVCELDCILEKIIEKCGCVGFEFLQFVKNATQCEIPSIPCWFYYRDAYKSIPSDCSSRCQRECVQYQFKLSLSQSAIGTNEMYDIATDKTNMTKREAREYFTENIVGFKISYRKLYPQEDTVTAVATWITVLSDIGGNLGLCMGLSILTVFELFFYIYDLIAAACNPRKKSVSGEGVSMEMANNKNVHSVVVQSA